MRRAAPFIIPTLSFRGRAAEPDPKGRAEGVEIHNRDDAENDLTLFAIL
jgi:hypothetical protein